MVVCVCLSVTENSDHLVITLQDGKFDTETSEVIGLVMTWYEGQSDKRVIGTITQFPPEVNSSAIIDPFCDLDLYNRYSTIKRITKTMTDMMTEACIQVTQSIHQKSL